MSRFRALASTAVVALTAGGCMGGDGVPLTKSELPRLVLQQSDLTGPWVRFDEGRQIRADALPGSRGDSFRFGRVEGWKARYRRSGSPSTRGPLVVESRADLFDSDSGAREDFEALRDDLANGTLFAGSQTLDPPELGAEALAVSLGEPASAGTVRFFLVAWRDNNATMWIFANGFEGRFTLDDAVILARKQQTRISAAKR